MTAFSPRRALVVAIGAVTLLLTACGGSEPATTGLDEASLVESLNRYWEQEADDLGFDYVPVPVGRVSDGTDQVRCDRRPVDADSEDLDENAFVDPDCSEGLLVAYDAEWVAREELRFELLLAHEWGHVIQASDPDIDVDGLEESLPIDAELQADCLAGAWAGQHLDEEQLEIGRERIAEFGDELHVPVDDPDAHSTPEERVEAFDLGVDEGPAARFGDALLDLLP